MDSLGSVRVENRAAYYDMPYIPVNWKIDAGIKKQR